MAYVQRETGPDSMVPLELHRRVKAVKPVARRNNPLPASLERFVMDYPAMGIEWRTICQGHADVCKITGHATHHVDDVLMAWCPRCGELTDPR